MRTLSDIVEPGIKVLFVGTNPGAKSARIGHYFAGASNMFWKLLFESKLTHERLTTELDYKVIDYGYGLDTDPSDPSGKLHFSMGHKF